MNTLGLTTRRTYESSLYVIEEFSTLGTCAVQEDATGCCIRENTSVMVLCDGIGGMERGDLAAKMAVDTILQCSAKCVWKENPVAFLRYAVEEANHAVFELIGDDGVPIQGGCTLVVVLTVGRKLYLANVGDSRAYVLRKEGFDRITTDHNYGEWLKRELEKKEITEEKYCSEIEKGAALTSYIGMGALKECFVSSKPMLLDRDEVLIVESDGLYKLVNENEIKEIICRNIRSLDEAGMHLLKRAREQVKGYQDNTSIILFRIK